jgi:N-dimethylarginine dimethylaminohydrolase
MPCGRLSEVGRIEHVILGHPADAFRDDARIDEQWRDLNFLGRPDYAAALDEYERFVELLRGEAMEISFLPRDESATLDAIYAHDAAVMSPEGAILCNMGKPQRRAEPEILGHHVGEIGLPLKGVINGAGRLEGGDVVWLDDHAVVVGRGYRTNDDGIDQLRALLGGGIETVVVPLPHWRGEADVFHLMSMLSPIDDDLALVFSPLLPVPFREWLLARGLRLVDVPEVEFETMGCNVLALAPRKCVMLEGNPGTKARLEAEGVDVRTYRGEEISRKGGGGPTCLTRPVRRA